jgi:hypothetical protein
MLIDKERISKLEEMLEKKLKASRVTFREVNGVWFGIFVVDNSRKFYGFKTVVKKYGGEIIDWSVSKFT